mgnify:CR=1 FL=1
MVQRFLRSLSLHLQAPPPLFYPLFCNGENPLQAECDRREPFYGIPSPGAAYKNSQTSGYVPEMSVAASGAEDVMAEKSIKALNAEITALRQELKDARQHGEALEAEISSLCRLPPGRESHKKVPFCRTLPAKDFPLRQEGENIL